VYVDDLAILTARAPQEIIDVLQDKYNFKLTKGTGPIKFYLGIDLWPLHRPQKVHREDDRIHFKQFFGTRKPSQMFLSPLEKGDHPEIDASEFLDGNKKTQQYQSLVGAMQWAVSIGHIDITTAVMSLSSFRAMPHHGHRMDRVKHIYGYLSKLREAVIRVCTDEPDYIGLADQHFDWEKSVCGGVCGCWRHARRIFTVGRLAR
jgi:hypothetical protein